MHRVSSKLLLLSMVLAPLLGVSSSYADTQNQASKITAITLQQNQIKFHPMPGLPAGAEIANIRGDLSKPELYTIRLKLPRCYIIPSHWHTNDEEVTVISGIFNVGLGDTIDKSQAIALTSGGFQLVPGKAHHYVWSSEDTVVQLDGMGPRDTIFVNPKELIPLFKGNNHCP
jgi:hypothetical protein